MKLISELIKSPVFKSNRIIRYSGIYQAEQEALSEHIISVQMLSYLIAEDLSEFGEDIDIGNLLEKGLLHDMDEVLTGDIPRTTKYATSQSKSILDEIALVKLKKLPKFKDHQIDIWMSAKDETKEGVLIRLADFLDVYKKIILEINQLGNKEFLSVAEEFYVYCTSIDWSSLFDIFKEAQSITYLKQLTQECIMELKDLLEHHSNDERGLTVSRV